MQTFFALFSLELQQVVKECEKTNEDTESTSVDKAKVLKLALHILENNREQANNFLIENACFDAILMKNYITFSVKNEKVSKSNMRQAYSTQRSQPGQKSGTCIEMTEMLLPSLVEVQMNILHLALCTKYEGIAHLFSKISEILSTRELEALEEEIEKEQKPSLKPLGIASQFAVGMDRTLRGRSLTNAASLSFKDQSRRAS